MLELGTQNTYQTTETEDEEAELNINIEDHHLVLASTHTAQEEKTDDTDTNGTKRVALWTAPQS